jgi:heme-degrading monooxygenase HmoA
VYANIATIPLQPGTTDRCLEILREAEPRLRELPGFRGWLVLSDGAETVLSLSLWATEAEREAAGGSPMVRDAMAGLAHLLAGAPTRHAYEVPLHTMP